MTPDRREELDLDFEVDVNLVFRVLRRAGSEGSVAVHHPPYWRAMRTPEGPASARYTPRGRTLVVESWGPGATWAVETAPMLLGAGDRPEDFTPAGRPLAELRRRLRGLRMPRTALVFESLFFAILEQRVTGIQAAHSARRIIRRYSQPAPGPSGLWLPPDPAVVARLPYWELHRLEVEERRAATLIRAAREAARLEAAASGGDRLRARLRAIPGVGPWTEAEVVQRALGDGDAVSVGDFHLPNAVCWALAGEARGDDRRMLELLEPYRGHRARVQHLLTLAGISAPKFAPRREIRWIAGS